MIDWIVPTPRMPSEASPRESLSGRERGQSAAQSPGVCGRVRKRVSAPINRSVLQRSTSSIVVPYISWAAYRLPPVAALGSVGLLVPVGWLHELGERSREEALPPSRLPLVLPRRQPSICHHTQEGH